MKAEGTNKGWRHSLSEAEMVFQSFRRASLGLLFDAADLDVSSDGRRATFTGFLAEEPGCTTQRICTVDLAQGELRVATFGPHSDRLPRISPAGGHIAFLSDRRSSGDFQLHLLDLKSGAVTECSSAPGRIEHFDWSIDGRRILVLVAGRFAQVANAQGATAPARSVDRDESWMPQIDDGSDDGRRRSLWIYDVLQRKHERASPAQFNVWEATWCGTSALVAVASDRGSESAWYSASVQCFAVDGTVRELYRPKWQVGVLGCSPSGRHLALVEAISSDRGYVAGGLVLLDVESGTILPSCDPGFDIAHIEWRSDRELLLAGHRGLSSVVGLLDIESGDCTEVWKDDEITTGGRGFLVRGIGTSGDCVLIGEGFERPPELAEIKRGRYRTIQRLMTPPATLTKALARAMQVSWLAPDGMEVQGWFLKPRGKPPFPTVMLIHGGPVTHFRSKYLGRSGHAVVMLLRQGYAILLPNPRGSSGRGHAFAEPVIGDTGGADAADLLSGIDSLVSEGVVDAHNLGVMGGSYGGFMTCWLVTQDRRFQGAVAVAPVSNRTSQYLTCSHPAFVSLFVGDRFQVPSGRFFSRSPIMHVCNVKTPTMLICGALDRCTPPGEARQFYEALREHGVATRLVTYPNEGHGVSNYPAALDFNARVLEWFKEHLCKKRRAA